MSQNPNNYENLYRPPSQQNIPEEPPQPFVMRSDEVDASAVPPQRMPAQYTAPQPVHKLPPPVPPKPKAPFSPIPLLLIAGVAFLFLGGIIFLTNTWDMLPDAARAFSLLSASIIAFGANVLAERVFKLPKTGLAFYILGCIFLPMAMAGIGAFELLGEWFSFGGDGDSLVWALVFACVAAPALFGQKAYKSPLLAWFGLAATGVSWLFLAFFTSYQIFDDGKNAWTLTCGLLVLGAAGATAFSEWFLRHKKDTPVGKIMLGFLYPLLLSYSICITILAVERHLSAAIMAVLMGVLFLNRRFIAGKLHGGIFGFMFCLLTALSQVMELRAFHDATAYEAFLFVTGAASVLLMGTFWLRKAHPALVSTFSITGAIFSIPMLVIGGIAGTTFKQDETFLIYLYGALLISILFFAFTKKHPLSKDTPFFCVHFAMLFIAATVSITNDSGLISLLLVLSALLLLVGAFLGKKLWCLVLAIGSCSAVLLRSLPDPLIWFCWFCTVSLLAGVIYSHLCKRPLLEKCCAWAGIPFLLASTGMTLDLRMEMLPVFTLLLALVTLLYLLETVVFWKHDRSEGTGRYLEVISLLLSFLVFIGFLNEKVSGGWGFLILLGMLVFTVAFVRKPKNALSIPYLIMLFFTARHMIASLETNHIITNESLLHLAQIGCFILILAAFAGMGRLLLPEGFFDKTDGRMQIDFPLLAGVFPVFGAAATIDWYPSILACLFLSLYSLLYLGRVKNRWLPALLASLFGCLTIFFHNANDPWDILRSLAETDIKTPQIILYLLPAHLFILSLLWILPEKCKSGVHMARFCMYCVTMLCLLASSFTFWHVTDALILVLFSFAILVGSFFIKRLRWFTLGFAVLVIMTFRLTRVFWQSLHWSIYLFLAGAVLIGIASAYELNARKQAEHPEEPKKKFKPFSTWKW